MAIKKTAKEFINNAIEIHGNRYDYSKVRYINAKTKVCVICALHGNFFVTPHNHLTNKSGCPNCSKNHKRYTTDSFIKEASLIHNNKYDYTKVNYKKNNKKVVITCPLHGEFLQTPNKHLQGCGCPVCAKEKKAKNLKKTKENFIIDARKIHGWKYDYSKVEYKNAHTKICIICPKHGEFWQTPHHHLNFHGCPVCKMSTLEQKIKNVLDENEIKYIYQFREKWLGKQSLDFYLPDYNIAIECQGEQHFKEIFYRSEKWKKDKREETLKKIKERDIKKFHKCKNNGIEIVYFSKLSFEFPYFVFTNEEELINFIKEKYKTYKNVGK